MKHYFDTESTDLFRGKKPYDLSQYRKWPAMAAYCGKLVAEDGTITRSYSQLIKLPKGVYFSSGAAAVNKLTWERCNDEGVLLSEALDAHWEMTKCAKLQVGFCTQFDLDMIHTNCFRAVAECGWVPPSAFEQCDWIDLQKYATSVCALPPTEAMIKAGRLGPKPPKLSEAMQALFGEVHANAHTAEGDVDACILLHRKIKEILDELKREDEAAGTDNSDAEPYS